MNSKLLLTLFFASQALYAVEMTDIKTIKAGFSKSALFETRDPAGFSFNAAFNEYAATQDQNEVGYKGSSVNSLPLVPLGSILQFGNNYHPGFRVGLNIDIPFDMWNFGAEYLWYRGGSKIKKTANSTEYFYSPVFIKNYGLALSSLEADWHLSLNLVDLYLTRPYYSGRKLTVDPLVGLKFFTIKQHFDLTADVLDGDWDSQEAKTKSKAWCLGPKIGGQSNYLMGKGFSIFGDLSTALLYTRYTSNSVKISNFVSEPSTYSNNRYGTVRPLLDTGIGLAWKGYFGFGSGAYSWNKTFYVTLSAAYNFSLFFSQNVSRELVSVAASKLSTPGNLYLQGVSVGLDFIF